MKLAVFTVATRAQLAEAKTLLDSASAFVLESTTFLLLAEKPEAAAEIRSAGKFSHEIIALNTLGLSDDELGKLAFQYRSYELSRALKPWAFDYFFEKGFDAAIYFDPQIELYSSPALILERLKTHDAVLTPCVSQPLEFDGYFPSNADVMRFGQFHSGFLALKATSASRKWVGYWRDELRSGAVVDPTQTWIGDQIFASSLPSFVDQVAVIRNLSYHISVWNCQQCGLTGKDGKVTTADGPLVFVNFEALQPRKQNESIVPWAIDFVRPGTVLRKPPRSPLLEKLILDHLGRIRISQDFLEPYNKQYSYGTFLTGDPILAQDRRIYLHMGRIEKRRLNNPFGSKPQLRKQHVVLSGRSAGALAREIKFMKSGPSWKIGRVMTWPLRRVRELMSWRRFN